MSGDYAPSLSLIGDNDAMALWESCGARGDKRGFKLRCTYKPSSAAGETFARSAAYASFATEHREPKHPWTPEQPWDFAAEAKWRRAYVRREAAAYKRSVNYCN